jgi:hypothetical protein
MDSPTAPTSLWFADTARNIVRAGARLGYRGHVSYRTPPKTPGQNRTLTRHANGSCLVSVVTRDRSRGDVFDDMLHGYVAALDIDDNRRGDVFVELLALLCPEHLEPQLVAVAGEPFT